MPALNVEFTETELEALRAIATERGVTLKALVREATTADIERHRALKEGADVFRRFFNQHEEEFAAAFPDDEPQHDGRTRAA
ncbi:hypothetical protein SAMN06297387_12832 [Streptomyces zhaozhouensis]|uniref:Ribbon-helix-helix protein, copG family n=1 Tax=Streptomyces zhaozhouensis TaxID=1300267 RepID=A0A286E7Z9_9ACTN|nr:hypothetical protein [Streptomyces zhaozhouensis]SOD67010.1 hypothetical protein SAMN06297387_12832 [Streptomyces zhaozhouensis]